MGGVLAEIMSFEGVEIYMKEWPQLRGHTFGEVMFAFDDAVPIGIKRFTHSSTRPSIFLNPRFLKSFVILLIVAFFPFLLFFFFFFFAISNSSFVFLKKLILFYFFPLAAVTWCWRTEMRL